MLFVNCVCVKMACGQSRFEEKTNTLIVNGSHETVKLSGLLEIFIKKYVQCYGCGNPETEILISKSQMVSLKCVACGVVSDVDMRDKKCMMRVEKE